MISFQKRFLFVHIPKTAGNSIQSALRDYSEDQLVALHKEQDGIERFGLRNPNYKIKKHSTLADYRAALGEDQFRSLCKFTCVRNPWDRMISRITLPQRKTRQLGTGRNSERSFQKLCQSRTISARIRAKGILSTTSIT